jgi:cyclophilin family peptidyl-prolyl cis-trans isomerase
MILKKNAGVMGSQRPANMMRYFLGIMVITILACQALAPTSQPDVVEQAATEPAADMPALENSCAIFDSIPTAEQYNQPPMKIEPSKQYFATFKMAKGGEFVVQLYPDKAPITVNSFVFLACKKFYDGTTFHRVLEGFMAQGGDPTGTGMGGPGYEFVNEDSDLTFDKAGVVAMANAGPDTNGSQFFITFQETPHLNGGYTIFGQVIEGMDVVYGITRRDPQQNPSFEGDSIESVTISE